MRPPRRLVERAGGDDLARAAADARRRVGRIVFGDCVGLAVFLGALAFFGLYWRIGIFVNDNYAIANALVGVADGHLSVERIAFGPDPEYQPGMNVVGDRLYARNYGHVVLALPFLWALELLALVAAPRIAIAGAWSLVVVAFAVTAGTLTGRRDAGAILGSVGGGILFAANVLVATPLERVWLPVAALQLATMVAAALVGVVLYRLLAMLHGRRVGAFAGFAVVFATPVGFWASIPKRHAVTALLAVIVLYGFARSRHAAGDAEALRFRALSYVAVGLTAWVHAAEALILFAVLVPLDLLTARSNDPRQLAGVALAFGVSLLPFLLTNALISGNPVRPPRMLTRYAGQVEVFLEGSGSGVDASSNETGRVGLESTGANPASGGSPAGMPAGDGQVGYDARSDPGGLAGFDPGTNSIGEGAASDTAGETPIAVFGAGPTADESTIATGSPETIPFAGLGSVGTALQGVIENVSSVLSGAATAADYFLSAMVRGVTVLAEQPERLYHTFVRSGWIDAQAPDRQAVNLTVLESAPLLGALVALPIIAGRYATDRWRERSIGLGNLIPATPRGQTDAFVLLYTLAFVVFYLPRLPLHVQVTVRYLLPVVPMLWYAVVRLAPIRRVVREAGTELAWSYAGFVLVGGQLGVAALAVLQLSVGEGLQLFALVGLLAAGLTGAWVVGDLFVDGLDARIGAGIVALTGAVSTAFLLVTGWGYLRYGDFALGIARLASELLSAL